MSDKHTPLWWRLLFAPTTWIVKHKWVHGGIILLACCSFLYRMQMQDWFRAALTLSIIALNGWIYTKLRVQEQHEWDAIAYQAPLFMFPIESSDKRKNDDPFYPEYWRGDVPPPPANPGYFESTR